ncbi:MAG: PLxRFG domain-containing protein [Dehalococcoidales bacterium]|nr:PLxRFG domain-containing protein [Dehalococcoidales bacterium]
MTDYAKWARENLVSPYSTPKTSTPVKEDDQPDAGYNVLGGLADIGRAVVDAPTHIKAAYGGLTEDKDPYARQTWSDTAREESEALQQQRAEQLGEQRQEKVFPSLFGLTPPITRGDLQDAAASIGFSGIAMGAGLAGSLLGTLAGGPVGGAAGGLGLSGAAAYKMSVPDIQRQLVDKTNQELINDRGTPMTDQERTEFLEKVNPDTVKYALAEAGPEALGNMLALSGIGTIFKGVSKGFAGKIASGLLKVYGGELATETATQQLQQPIQAKHGLTDEAPRSLLSLADWGQSFKEVYPATMALATATAGAGGLAGVGKRIATREAADVQPTSDQPTPDQIDFTRSLTESLATGKMPNGQDFTLADALSLRNDPETAETGFQPFADQAILAHATQNPAVIPGLLADQTVQGGGLEQALRELEGASQVVETPQPQPVAEPPIPEQPVAAQQAVTPQPVAPPQPQQGIDTVKEGPQPVGEQEQPFIEDDYGLIEDTPPVTPQGQVAPSREIEAPETPYMDAGALGRLRGAMYGKEVRQRQMTPGEAFRVQPARSGGAVVEARPGEPRSEPVQSRVVEAPSIPDMRPAPTERLAKTLEGKTGREGKRRLVKVDGKWTWETAQEPATSPQVALGSTITDEGIGEVGGEKSPDLDTMVKAAQKWRGAAMKAAKQIAETGDKRAQLRHSNITTKADLDDYLMRQFGVDATTARDVSNTLTAKNLPDDQTARIEDYQGEPWADAILAQGTAQDTPASTPTQPQTPQKPTISGKAVGEVGVEGKKAAKEPWEMSVDDYIASRFENERYKGISKQAPRAYIRKHEDSVKDRLREEWYAENEKAYIDGNDVPDANRPIWSINAKQYAARSDDILDEYIRSDHKNAVAEALREGKPVPAEVLKEYPDLQPKPTPNTKEKGQPIKIVAGYEDRFQDSPSPEFTETAGRKHLPSEKGRGLRIFPIKAHVSGEKDISTTYMVRQKNKQGYSANKWAHAATFTSANDANAWIANQRKIDRGDDWQSKLQPKTTPRPTIDEARGALQVAERKAAAKKTKQAQRPNITLVEWVRLVGGIRPDDPSFKGELRDATKDSRGRRVPPGFFNSKSPWTMDTLAQEAMNDGFISDNSDDTLMAALERDINASINDDKLGRVYKSSYLESDEYIELLAQRDYDEWARENYSDEEIEDGTLARDEAKAQAALKSEVVEEVAREERANFDEVARFFDEVGVKEQQSLFGGASKAKGKARETLKLEGDKLTPWEKKAELERQGVLKKGTIERKELVFPKEGIKPGTGGKQRGLFDEKEQNLDLFAYVPSKPPVKAEETPVKLPGGQHTRMVTTGDVRAASLVVRDLDDAAALLSHIRKQAQENIYTILTDKDGNVLEIHRAFKGTNIAAQADLVSLAGRAFNVPGAKTIYFIHNHPTGDPTPSAQDREMLRGLSKASAIGDIDVKGLVIGGRNWKEVLDPYASRTERSTVNQPIRPEIKTSRIPVKERTIVRGSKLINENPVTTFEEAHRVVKRVFDDGMGFLLMDQKNNPLGFVPFQAGGFVKPMARDLIAAIESSNAAAIIFNHPDKTIPKTREQTLQAVITGLRNDVRFLDIVVDGKSSVGTPLVRRLEGDLGPQFVERALGSLSTAEDVRFSSTQATIPTKPLSPASIRLIAKSLTKGWQNVASIEVVQSTDDIQDTGIRKAVRTDMRIKGVFAGKGDQRKIFLVSENLGSRKDVADTLLEETLGHDGLRQAFGDKLNPFLDQVYAKHGDQIRPVAKRYRIDLSEQAGQREATDEWIAKQIATDTLPRQIWDRIVAAIRGWIRKIMPGLQVSVAEAKALARKAVMEGPRMVGGGAAYRFLMAWHGTPHVWQPEPGFPHGRPRLDKIGTGEGGAAYGWGWYSTDEKETASHYHEKLSVNRDTWFDSIWESAVESINEYIEVDLLDDNQNPSGEDIKDFVVRIAEMEKDNLEMNEYRFAKRLFDVISNLDADKFSVVDNKVYYDGKPYEQAVNEFGSGALYKLEIPDDIIPKLLDWDKPLSDQPNIVKTLKDNGGWLPTGYEKVSGGEYYNWLVDRLGSQKKASEDLQAIGIPGNTHGGISKGATGKKYVIWDQTVLDRIALLERNAEKLDAMREAEDVETRYSAAPATDSEGIRFSQERKATVKDFLKTTQPAPPKAPFRNVNEGKEKQYAKVTGADHGLVAKGSDAISSTIQALREASKEGLLPGGFWDKLITSPEWTRNEVEKTVVQAAIDRDLDRHNLFYHLDHEKETDSNGWEVLKALKNRGVSVFQRVRSRELYNPDKAHISKEYRQVWDAVNHMDEQRVRWDDTAEETIPDAPEMSETKNTFRLTVNNQAGFDKKGMDESTFKNWSGYKTARGEGVRFIVGKIDGEERLQSIQFRKAFFKDEAAIRGWLQENRRRLGGEKGYRSVLEAKGVSQDVIGAIDHFRKAMDKSLNLQRAKIKDIINAYKAAGKTVPTLFVEKDSLGKPHAYTLKDAYEEMGTHEGYYAPRIRENGEWIVTGEKEGQFYRFHTQSRRKAIEMEKALQRDGFEKLHHKRDERSLPETIYEDLTIGEVGKALEEALEGVSKDVDPDVQLKLRMEAIQAASDMLKARAFRSHKIARKTGVVVKGFIEDPLTRYILSLNQVAGGIAKGMAAQKMFDAYLGQYRQFERDDDTNTWIYTDDKDVLHSSPMTAEEIDSERKTKTMRVGGLDAGKHKELHGKIKDYIVNQLRNPDRYDRMVGLGKSIVSFKFLGFNPRSMLVNTTAMIQTVPPAIHAYALDGKGDMTKILAVVAKAGKDYARVMRGKKLLNSDEQTLMDEIQEKGYDAPQYMHDALGSIHDLYGGAWSNVMNLAMKPFGITEQWNRGSTILAAYRLIKRQNPGISHEDAAAKAMEASNLAHGQYGKATLPAWAQGKGPGGMIGQMLYTYQKFGHNYVQMLADLGFQKKNIKALSFALAAPAIISGGSASLVFAGALALVRGMLAALGYDDDPEKMVYDTIRKELGNYPEQMARYGLFGALGIDISGSIAIGMEVPRTLLDLTGPFGGVYESIADSARYLKTGQPWRAVERAAPMAVGNIMTGIREAGQGASTKRGYPIFDEEGKPYEPGPIETGLKVAGFRGSRRAAVGEREWESKRTEGRLSDRKSRIYEQYRAWVKGDGNQEELQKIMDEVRAYNERVDRMGFSGIVPKITPQSLKRQLKRMTTPTKAERGRRQMQQ